MVIILIISILIFLLLLFYMVYKEQMAFYHPLCLLLLWHFITYIYYPLFVIIDNDYGVLNSYGLNSSDDYYLIKPLILATLGLSFFYFGWLKTKSLHKFQFKPVLINSKVSIFIGIIFLALAIYSINNFHYIPIVQNKIINPMTRGEFGGSIFTGGSGYIYTGYYFISGVSLLWYFVSYKRNKLFYCISCVMIFAYVLINVMRGWHRSGWVSIIYGIICLWLVLNKRYWPPKYFLIIAIPLMILFNISGGDRQAIQNILEKGDSIVGHVESANERALNKHFGNDFSTYAFNCFMVYVYPDKVLYEYGRTFFNEWIVAGLPRVIIEDKDKYRMGSNIEKSIYIKQTVGAINGLYFDLYTNYGMVGIIIGCFSLGYIFNLVWQIFLIYKENGSNYQYIILVYVGIIMGFPFILGSGLSQLFQIYLHILFPICLVLIISKYLQKDSSSKPILMKRKDAKNALYHVGQLRPLSSGPVAQRPKTG